MSGTITELSTAHANALKGQVVLDTSTSDAMTKSFRTKLESSIQIIPGYDDKHFHSLLANAYNRDLTKTTQFIWDVVLCAYINTWDAVATPIIPTAAVQAENLHSDRIPILNGLASPSNGLLVHYKVAEAFENGRMVIVPGPKSTFRIRFLDLTDEAENTVINTASCIVWTGNFAPCTRQLSGRNGKRLRFDPPTKQRPSSTACLLRTLLVIKARRDLSKDAWETDLERVPEVRELMNKEESHTELLRLLEMEMIGSV